MSKYQAKTSSLKFRRKKDQFANIFIPKTAVKVTGKIFNVFKRYKIGDIKSKTELKINHDFQIRWNRRLDSWCVITFEEIEPKRASNTADTIVIDPGIRTFLTSVDSYGLISEIGKNWSSDKRIKERINKMDKADARLKKPLTQREYFRARRDFHLHKRKLHHMIDDLHKKTARWLLSNYDVVVLPKLRAKTLLKTKGGLGSKVNRQISLLAHGNFTTT